MGLPVVQAALGEDWQRLPETLRRNFDLHPGDEDLVCLEGRMYEIRHSWFAKLLIYPAQLCGALVPYQGRDVPIRIEIHTSADNGSFMHWRRIHHFPGKAPVVFASCMEYFRGNEIIERVGWGLGMRMRVSLDGDVLRFTSVCYQWDILGVKLRIPNWLLLGRGQLRERQVTPEKFEMFFEINHPLWGRTFTYNGVFTFVDPPM